MAGQPGFVGANRPDSETYMAVERPDKRPLFFSRYRQTHANLGLVEPTPLADQLMVSVELNARGFTDMFKEETHFIRPAIRPGALGLFDLRSSWRADVRDPFDNVNMFLPLSSFDEYADDHGVKFGGFDYRVGQDLRDEVMLHLALAMAPALEIHDDSATLFLNYCFLAARDHIARSYCAFSATPRDLQNGLTATQKRIALDYMEIFLQTSMSLADIAGACDMSVSNLGRAFKVTMGVPPHRWLLHRRIERAKQLLLSTRETAANIALSCGFYDQSHFTRAFVRHVGSSPNAWRRDRR
jgi:AraC family transcriptional regulator